MSSTSSREYHRIRAKLCERADCYEQMVEEVKKMYECDPTTQLTCVERNLFSAAFKNVVGARRFAHRALADHKPDMEENEEFSKSVNQSIRDAQSQEIVSLCDQVIGIVKQLLMNPSLSTESKVFYYKMCGDYNRYKAEIDPPNKTEIVATSDEAYRMALENSAVLPRGCLIKMGFLLNYSVFLYEMCGKSGEAISVANQALQELGTGQFEETDELNLITQLFHDNLSLWKSGQSEE